MTLHSDDIIEEWEVLTLLDFLNKVGFKEECKKRNPEVKDIMDGEIYDHITSDEDEISALLDEDHNLWTMTFISDRHDGYWIIRKIKNREIEIPFTECDVQEMMDEDWDRDWTFDNVDVHLLRQEMEDDDDEESDT